MYSEDDLLPISALQHLLFCERQTALIHIERLWADNRYTAEGNVLHKKADASQSETRDGVRITRSLPVHCFKLGLFGVCDVVQFQPPTADTQSNLPLPKRINQELKRRASFSSSTSSQTTSDTTPTGFQSQPVKQRESAFHHWTITPVEYKRGKPKANDCDRVQLCAQALALEEMLGVQIPRGELFYGKQQRRTEVNFDQQLKATTAETAERLHSLIRQQQTPVAMKEKKCETCSLLEACMPPSPNQKSASQYLKTMINQEPV